MFVLDSSASIGDQFFQIINFVRDAVNDFNIGDAGAQFGVVRYEVNVSLPIPLARFHTRVQLLEAINRLDPNVPACTTRFCTNTGGGIRVAAEELNGPHHRPYAKKVMIVVTDGQANIAPFGNALINFADMVRLADIEIFAVGIGSRAPNFISELNGIASDPDATHVFQAATFGEISRFISDLSDATCSSK